MGFPLCLTFTVLPWFSLLFNLVLASFSVSPASSTLKQCSQVDLIWTEEPPIQLWVAPNRDISPGDPTLADLGVINSTFLLWTVNIPVGQNISFTYVTLANRFLVLSSTQAYTVVAGDNTTCLEATSSSPTAISLPSSSTDRTATPTSTPTSTPTATSQMNIPASSTSSSTSHTPIIVGVTAGGVILLVLIGLGIYVCLRRRRRSAHIVEFPVNVTQSSVVQQGQPLNPTPYNLYPEMSAASSTLPSASSAVLSPLHSVSTRNENSTTGPSVSASIFGPSRGIGRRGNREVDAGPVDLEAEEEDTNSMTLPPAYEDLPGRMTSTDPSGSQSGASVRETGENRQNLPRMKSEFR